MRKPAFYICENKVTDQLRGAADHHLCFSYIDCTIPLLPKSALAMFFGSTAQFVSDLVENPGDRLSCDTAHLILKHTAEIVCCCRNCLQWLNNANNHF